MDRPQMVPSSVDAVSKELKVSLHPCRAKRLVASSLTAVAGLSKRSLAALCQPPQHPRTAPRQGGAREAC